MIKELENHRISYDFGYGGPTREEIIEKINEIIRYLNEKEERNDKPITRPFDD